MNNLIALYDASKTVNEWEKCNQPNPNLCYKSGCSRQCNDVRSIANLLNSEEPRVISTHTSKSVLLPVVAFRKSIPPYNLDTIAVIRNNFHDLCCQVISTHEMELSLYDIYCHKTKEEMEIERQKAHKYNPKYGEQGDPNDFRWYSSWSGGEIIQNDHHLFIIRKGWFEGFPCGGEYEERKYYNGPTKDFSFLAKSYGHATHVFQLALNASENKAISQHYGE